MIGLANHIWRGALGVGLLLGMLNGVARIAATPIAARETMVYEAGKFASFDLEELQTFEKGRVAVGPDPKNPEKEKLFFEYTIGQGSDARKKSNTEALENQTL